ncbi:hypothetical protein HDZ31DRAFT_60184 [Schizophyllum fasciatum]
MGTGLIKSNSRTARILSCSGLPSTLVSPILEFSSPSRASSNTPDASGTTAWSDAPVEGTSEVSTAVTETGSSGASTAPRDSSTSISEIITTSALSTDSSRASAIQSTIVEGSSDLGSTTTEIYATVSITESTSSSRMPDSSSSPTSAPSLSTTASILALAKSDESSSATESPSTSEDSDSTATSTPAANMPSDTASEPSSSSSESTTSTESESISTSAESATTTATTKQPTSDSADPTSDETTSTVSTTKEHSTEPTSTEAKTTTSDSGASPSETSAEASETSAGRAEKTGDTRTVTSMVNTTLSPDSSSATATRTVTDSAPDSTLSEVKSVTSTYSDAEGRVFTTVEAPSIITITSTSTGEGGGFVYSTHVVANPTGFSGSGAISEKGFFHNTGAVAGTFTVVGLVAAAAAFFIFWICRKRRRAQRRRRWMATVDKPPYTQDSPFEDPLPRSEVLPPLTPLTASRAASVRFADDGRPTSSPLLPGPPPLLSAGQPPYAGAMDLARQQPSPFADPIPQMATIQPLNVAPRYAFPQAEPESHSLAPSSPSVYPDSLPPEDEQQSKQGYGDPFEDRPQPSYIVQAPPRPARSHLRRESSKVLSASLPLTPPDSMNGHSPTASPDQSRQNTVYVNDRIPPF